MNLRSISGAIAVAALLILLLGLPGTMSAQRYNITYAPNSQEGLLLQLIEQLDGQAQIDQMNVFLERYPTHQSVNWIYAHQQDYYTKNNDLDKALAAGAKLHSLNPDDLETAVNNQKLAERKNDAALIEKWAAAATGAAQKLIGSQKPFYITQEEWNKRLAYAGSLIAQSDYQLYKQAMDSEKPAERIKFFDELILKNPNSFYAMQAWPHMMRAYRSMGSNDRAISMGEKILAKDPDHEDALLTVAQIYLDRRTNYPRVMVIANRLLTLGQAANKPVSFSEEDWQKRRGFYVGAAYTMIGNANVFQNNFAPAEKAFRAALPFIKGNPLAEASAYFYLGWCNYYMENYREAAAFFKICMGMQGPFQSQAARQLEGMKRERRIVE